MARDAVVVRRHVARRERQATLAAAHSLSSSPAKYLPAWLEVGDCEYVEDEGPRMVEEALDHTVYAHRLWRHCHPFEEELLYMALKAHWIFVDRERKEIVPLDMLVSQLRRHTFPPASNVDRRAACFEVRVDRRKGWWVPCEDCDRYFSIVYRRSTRQCWLCPTCMEISVSAPAPAPAPAPGPRTIAWLMEPCAGCGGVRSMIYRVDGQWLCSSCRKFGEEGALRTLPLGQTLHF